MVTVIVVAALLLILGGILIPGRRTARLLRNGTPGVAKILDTTTTGSVGKNPEVTFRLPVEPNDAPPFEVRCRRALSQSRLDALVAAGQVDVRYNLRQRRAEIWFPEYERQAAPRPGAGRKGALKRGVVLLSVVVPLGMFFLFGKSDVSGKLEAVGGSTWRTTPRTRGRIL